jgi:hypothetical protein
MTQQGVSKANLTVPVDRAFLYGVNSVDPSMIYR